MSRERLGMREDVQPVADVLNHADPAGDGLRRLRIAFVVHDYHRSGGHSRYVAELASRFSSKHEVHVFANTYIAGEDHRVHFHKIPAWRLNALTTILTFAVPAALRLGKNFDIVHVQGFVGPRGNVVTTHICSEGWFRALSRQKESLTWRDRVFQLVTGALERSLYERTNQHVIAISRLVARNVAELYHCTAPTHVIYHGVDLATFSPATRGQFRRKKRRELGIADDEMVFLFVGNLRKGARHCIRALAQLKSGVFLLVSPSPPEPYRRLADQLGCGGRAKFTGASDRIAEAYAAADAFIFPTPYDSFGLVITEAMACGLPVITTREAGASELICHGENGLLLEDPTDPDELAAAMDRLRCNRNLADDLGRAAHYSVQGLRWDSVADQTMQVYQQALAPSHS